MLCSGAREARPWSADGGGTTSELESVAAAVAALHACLPIAEPPAAALAAEACRAAWRPARLEVLLLAESHIATSAAELARHVRLPSGLDWPGPAGFIRHLYCAGYGEPTVLEGAAPRGGTPQYWRLLAAAEGAGAPAWSAVRHAGTRPKVRLVAKAALLHRLRARGIWLTDASLVALARPVLRRSGTAAADRLALRESWRLHHRHVLPALAPRRVVVIGRGVAAALADVLDRAFPGRWSAVPQPNGARAPDARAALLAAVAHACADRGGVCGD